MIIGKSLPIRLQGVKLWFVYCPNQGMGEKPSPLGEDSILFFDAAGRIQGFKASRKGLDGLSLDPSNPWILGPQAFGFGRRVLTSKNAIQKNYRCTF